MSRRRKRREPEPGSYGEFGSPEEEAAFWEAEGARCAIDGMDLPDGAYCAMMDEAGLDPLVKAQPDALPAQRRPCTNCPWRADAQPGEFTAERYRVLAASAYDRSFMIFTCHKSPEGGEVVCAGFLERGAEHNLAVRLAYSQRRLERFDRSGGLRLHSSYRAMAIANGVAPDEPLLEPCR